MLGRTPLNSFLTFLQIVNRNLCFVSQVTKKEGNVVLLLSVNSLTYIKTWPHFGGKHYLVNTSYQVNS